MRLILLLRAALYIVPGLFVMHGQAQNVNGVLIDATNTVTRNPSAAFQINANTNTPGSPVYGGLLIPQVALSGTNDATTISGTEADGLLVFNTNDGGGVTKGYYYWNTGTNSWVRVLSTTSGITGVANPTATIGLTAVNGTATTALRSDGAPALSQAIVPTWTGTHTFSNAAAIRMSNGTAALPALSFTGDPNTGMYWHSADAIGFSTAGVEKMSIASNGDIELNNMIAIRSNDAWLRLNPTNAFTNGIYVANFLRVDGGIASGGAGSSGAGTIRATNFITSDVGFRISNAAANGTYLRGNGTNYVSSAIQAADIPTGSGNYIQNQTAAAQATSNYWISGYGRANDFRSADGTAAQPAFRFANDTDIGMYRAFDNTLAFATTGAERMRIAADGNVGIGTTGPSRKLHVVGDIYSTGQYFINNTSPTLYLQDTDHRSGMIHMNSNLMYFLNGSANNSTTWTQNGAYWPLTINMTNDVATFGGAAHFMEGNVGIGTATPNATLHVTGDFYNQEIHGVTNTANQDIAWNATVTEINTGGYATVVKGDGTTVTGSAILVVASVTVSGNTITFADGVGGYQEVNALANGIASFTITLERRINAGAWTSLISQSAMCGMAIGDWYLQYNAIPTMSGIKGDIFRFPNSVSISYFDTPTDGTVEYRLTFTQGGFRKNGGNYRVSGRNLTAVQIKR